MNNFSFYAPTYEGISYVELGGVKPNPRSGLVYEGIELEQKDVEAMYRLML